MTLSATSVRGGRQTTWTRDKIIEALRRYAVLYGDDFTAAAFSPSTAKWRDEPQETIDRYYLGDPETGQSWPGLNTIKKPFDGSFNAARAAAGLPPNKPGQKKRTAGEHRPVRDVSHAKATRTVYVEKKDDEAVAKLAAKLSRAEARIERLTQEIVDAQSRVKIVRAPVSKPKTITKTKTITDDAEVRRLSKAMDKAERDRARLEKALAEAREALDIARAGMREARSAATGAASKQERAEATVATLRAEKRELIADHDREVGELSARIARLEARTPEIEKIVVTEESPEAAVVRDAERRAVEAETRAARFEREYRELVVAVKGEDRRLTRDEIRELRSDGPAGPTMLAAALKELAAARPAGNRAKVGAALTKVASAAVDWKDRL